MVATNFIDGVTNATADSTLGQFIMPDPTSAHVFFDDFDRYIIPVAVVSTPVAGDFHITGTPGTVAAASADGGVLTLTNDTTTAHLTNVQWSATSDTVQATFAFDPALSMWGKFRFKTNVVANSALLIGLEAATATPQTVVDGLVWFKAATDTSLSFKAVKSSTATTLTSVGALTDNTYCTIGFWYAGPQVGDGVFRLFFNDQPAGVVPLTNMPAVSTLMAFTAGVVNGTSPGTAPILSIDYAFIAKRRL